MLSAAKHLRPLQTREILPCDLDDGSSARRSWGALPYAILLAALAVSLTGCEEKPAVVQAPPPEVAVARPLVKEVTDYFEFTGNTAAVEEVELRARVSGYIIKINFRDGQEVKNGDVLVEIDPRPYQSALELANAEVARAKAANAKADADLARAEKLLPNKVISQEEYDQHVAASLMSKANIQAAEASLHEAQLNLDYTKVVAPIGGRTSKAAVTVGNLVQSGATGSTLLTTIVSADPIYVYFNVDERSMLLFQEEARKAGEDARPDHIKDLKIPVEIALATEDTFGHAGILDFADNRVDPQTGTIRCRAVLPNPDRQLAPGLFVRVRLPFGAPHKALLVSDRAIGSDQSLKYLLVVDAANTVVQKPVKLGGIQFGLRAVDGGITADDWIIINGTQRARPGMKVTPRQTPMLIPPGQSADQTKT